MKTVFEEFQEWWMKRMSPCCDMQSYHTPEYHTAMHAFEAGRATPKPELPCCANCGMLIHKDGYGRWTHTGLGMLNINGNAYDCAPRVAMPRMV